MELKTLKELSKNMNLPNGYVLLDYCLKKDLKQEAIKWIKAFNNGDCHTDFAADNRNGQENIVEWIEHFFGISDKDLE